MSLSINPKFLSGLMTTDQELLNEAQVRQDADVVLQSNIDDEASARQAADAAEAALREAGDLAEASARQAAIDAETSARQAAIQDLSDVVQGNFDLQQSDIDGLRSDVDANSSALSSETSAREAADLVLDGKIEAEKSRIDAILSAAEADKDSFAEIVTLINSVDTENDQAFAGYVSSNDLRVSEVESDLAQEVSDRQAGDSATLAESKSYTDAQIAAIPGVDLTPYYTKTEVDAIQSSLSSDISDLDGYAQDIRSDVDLIESNLSSESSARQLADQSLQSQIDALNGTYATDSELAAAILGVQSEISSEQSARELADSGLQSQIDTEKGRIDAILSASQADKDSFAEIVTLINSVDTENDQAFAGYVLSNDAALAQEVSDRQAGDSALDQRIVPMEEILEFEKAIVYENNAAVYADAQPGIEDSNLRPGWYYKNTVAGQKINWYFFDGVNQANVSLGDLSAYAVMTFDSVSPVKSPIMAVYTMPTGTNDVMPGFAHSRVVYNGFSSTPVAGKKYLVYFGQNPAIHPELPRLQLSMSASNSIGEKNPSERVLTTSFGSNSGDAVNTVQFMVEALGISSPSYKGEVELKIRGASLKKLEDITSRLAAIEDNGFSNGNITIGTELGFIDLDRQYSKLMSVAIGRLAIHEGEDFTVSVVGGKTRLTWINSLAVGGDQAIQTGDRVFFVGAY